MNHINQKGFVNIVLAVVMIGLVILVGTVGYFMVNQSTPIKEKIAKEKIVGDYQWNDTVLQTQYSNIFWNKITISRLAGFSPQTALSERKTDCRQDGGGSYLRSEGGLCHVGFWLEDSSGQKVDSLEKLALRFAPVENESEAVSFVAAVHGDLKTGVNEILEGHTLTIADGFLVELTRKNTFGCGSHEPTEVIFKISPSGEMQEIASEKEKPASGPILCVD